MANQKQVSIVMPAYNMEAYMEKGLDSLVNARNIGKAEIIIVNDGSKDGTLKIARGYEERLPDVVKVIDKPNGHYGSCINAALEIAAGRYFRILDADDWMDTAALEAFIDKLESCDADLVVTRRVEVETTFDGKQILTASHIEGIEYDRVYDAREFVIREHSSGCEFNMHSMTYKTDILRKANLRLPEGICYTDLLYCLVPLDRTETLVMFDLKLYHYRLARPGSSTDRRSVRRNLTHIATVLAKMFEYIDGNKTDVKAIEANRQRFACEAAGIFFESLRGQRFVRSRDYANIAIILDGLKKHDIHNKLMDKYYFRPWVEKNTCAALNYSFFLWYATHPMKLIK